MKQKKLTTVLMAALLFMACSKDDNPTPQPQNQAPMASAGEDRQVELGSTVALDASGSTDADGDDLTYKWTFAEKPDESDAVIVGALDDQAEFMLDRAGTYLVNLEVNDGELTATASVTVTNKAPVLDNINSSTGIDELENSLARRGKTINISGDYFSGNIEENIVTLGGINCDVEFLDSIDNPTLLNIIVPEEAVGGDLVVTVGPYSVTWPEPIKMISLPVEDLVSANTQWERRQRSDQTGYDPTSFKTIGTRFKPLADGTVIGFRKTFPSSDEYWITIWEWETEKRLKEVRTDFINPSGDFLFKESLVLKKDKIYVIAMTSNDWYLQIDPQNETGDLFPKTVSNFEILNTVSGENQTNKFFPSFPSEESPLGNYIVEGPDIIFVEDIESN